MTTLPIPFDHSSGAPFYRQIYDGYRAAILSGQLRPGERLPSTRALATDLGISRLPAVYAFEQLLHEGYIEGRSGSGTFVKETIPDELTVPEEVPAAETTPVTWPRHSIDLAPFRVSLPALDRFPLTLWSRLVARHAKKLTIETMAYGDPAGHGPLREAIADYLRTARAVRCDAGQVLIVSGSQMALQICALALLPRGRSVCIEEPGYLGARDALQRSGARLVPVGVDDEGIDVEALAARGRDVRAVYVTPSHQHPLGVPMTASRRLALLEWARRSGSWILEDDYDSEYRYASRPLSALQGLDASERVIYIGTFSKVLFPALRIGYVVVPRALVDTFRAIRESLDIFQPSLEQLVHIRRMRALYHKRRDALLAALREYVPMLQPYNSDAGLHLTAFLPEGMDDCRVVEEAARRGISVTALSTCYAGPNPRHGLILGFGGASERRIRTAAKKLGEVLEDCLRESRIAAPRLRENAS